MFVNVYTGNFSKEKHEHVKNPQLKGKLQRFFLKTGWVKAGWKNCQGNFIKITISLNYPTLILFQP